MLQPFFLLLQLPPPLQEQEEGLSVSPKLLSHFSISYLILGYLILA